MISMLEWLKVRDGVKPSRFASACSFLVIFLLLACFLFSVLVSLFLIFVF